MKIFKFRLQNILSADMEMNCICVQILTVNQKKIKKKEKTLSGVLRTAVQGFPVVKTSPSKTDNVGLIPGWGAKIPYALGQKNKNHGSNIATNSIKT